MREKTLDELIDQLVELREEGAHVGGLPVRVAWQSDYPLFGSVVAVVLSKLGPDDAPDSGENAIYLAGGGEDTGYLDEQTAQALRSEGWH